MRSPACRHVYTRSIGLRTLWCIECGAYRKYTEEGTLYPWALPKPVSYWQVVGHAMWFVVRAKNKREAYSEGVKEFGRGGVSSVTMATADDVEAYIRLKGVDALRGRNT